MRKTAAFWIALFLTASGLVGSATAQEVVREWTYVTMSDGVQIAVSVTYPQGFDPAQEYPALFAMDGYAGGGGGLNPATYGHRYVTVYASIRGTGCSGGRFDLFDRIHAEDGREIIDNWIATQEWSNRKVGIVGHSYPGLTGWMVASTDPDHLTAIALSGLIDDLYRGIVYIGGVPNYGFPAVWTIAYRTASELAGNANRYATADPQCLANIATRPPRHMLDDPVVQGLAHQEDNAWWASRSTISYIRGITKPIHITQQYQDEQTGPRGGARLWEEIAPDIPKRLVMTNGRHAQTAVATEDRVAWLDCWIIGDCQDGIDDPDERVRLHFETTANSGPGRNDPYVSSDFPLPESDWQRLYMREDATLDASGSRDDASRIYLSTPAGTQIRDVRQSGGVDQLLWTYDEPGDFAIAGPMTLNLWARASAPDVDFFVEILDVGPDGEVQPLQRGMLRGSHRALDELRSDRLPSGDIYRPHHPHTSTTTYLVPVWEPTEFVIEVFPVGHVFRDGHKLVVALHAPPPIDPIADIYLYQSLRLPSVVEVLQDSAHPSSLLVPFLTALPPLGDKPGCGAQIGIPCVRPVL